MVNPVQKLCVTKKEHRVIYRLVALRYFQRLTTFHVLLISQNFHTLLSSLLFHLSHAAVEIWDWLSNIILGKCPPHPPFNSFQFFCGLQKPLSVPLGLSDGLLIFSIFFSVHLFAPCLNLSFFALCCGFPPQKSQGHGSAAAVLCVLTELLGCWGRSDSYSKGRCAALPGTG